MDKQGGEANVGISNRKTSGKADCGAHSSRDWPSRILKSETDVIEVLADLGRKGWLSRGQSKCYPRLVPPIDRDRLQNLPRLQKLALERQSINLFRSTVHFFAGPGEQGALIDPVVALMVMRHYGVPTRLLDWSTSPYVAAYFAACSHDEKEGEIWSFDMPEYGKAGKEQWKKWRETTSDHSGNADKFEAPLTMFMEEEPPHWIIAAFYDTGFPRQNAQYGAYTMTARFGCDHASKITELFADFSDDWQCRCCRYVVSVGLKPRLRSMLLEKHGIWRGFLFPDSAGSAETVNKVVFRDYLRQTRRSGSLDRP